MTEPVRTNEGSKRNKVAWAVTHLKHAERFKNTYGASTYRGQVLALSDWFVLGSLYESWAWK